MRAWFGALVAVCFVGACGPSEWRPPSAEDSHEDPNKLRPGYGNDALHTWWPLTEPEVAAVQGAERARQGDAHALLALAIMASGDKRDADTYTRYFTRFDRFVADQRAAVESAGEPEKRGDALNRAMHHVFLNGSPNKQDPKIGAYELDQARLSQIFEQGHYNCISSALLYATLACAFSLPVRAAITETHAFIDFGPEDGKRVDVETTTATGFGEIHDEKFYRDAAKDWSSSRGLKPMTYDEYKKREIVPPYVLVARGMSDKRIVNDDTQGRLAEAAAILAPDDVDSVHNRMASYLNEAKWLYEHKAYRTVLRLIEVVAPFVSDVASRFPKNDKLMSDVAWMAWHDANALLVVGRGDEAVEMAEEGLDHLQPTWDDAKSIRKNLLNVLMNRMTEAAQVSHEYEKSLGAIQKHIDACRTDDSCLNNLYLTFDSWCVKYQLAKDWPSAKKVMQTCIGLLPDDTRCHHTLEGLTSQHP